MHIRISVQQKWNFQIFVNTKGMRKITVTNCFALPKHFFCLVAVFFFARHANWKSDLIPLERLKDSTRTISLLFALLCSAMAEGTCSVRRWTQSVCAVHKRVNFATEPLAEARREVWAEVQRSRSSAIGSSGSFGFGGATHHFGWDFHSFIAARQQRCSSSTSVCFVFCCCLCFYNVLL